MKYLKVFTDFALSLELLGDVEAGRLFKAMLKYAESGEDTELRGNERFLWMVAKTNIDREREFCEKQANNGKQGGRPAKNPKKPNETQNNPEKPKKSQKSQQDKDKDKDKEKKLLLSPLPPSLGDGGADKQKNAPDFDSSTPEDEKQIKKSPFFDEHLKEVITLWDGASGRIMTGWESQRLVELLDLYGKDRVVQAINAAAANNSVKINYVTAVLENRGKKANTADNKSKLTPEQQADLDAWLRGE